jgi:hypothetical protein
VSYKDLAYDTAFKWKSMSKRNFANDFVFENFLHVARDFGSLIPEIKAYSRDIVPGIIINPKERVAIMRKGAVIRLKGECMYNAYSMLEVHEIIAWWQFASTRTHILKITLETNQLRQS